MIDKDKSTIVAPMPLGSFARLIDRFPEAESTLQQASERKLGNPHFLVFRYMIAALEGDNDEMNRAMALAKGKRGADQ